MLKEILISEFKHEAENTRKLLKAIPDSALQWKPAEKNWTIAELASHIAGIYDWYEPVFNRTHFEVTEHHYDKGDISKTENIVAKFEENVAKAQKVLENFEESQANENWTMTAHGNTIIPEMPKIAVIRNVLCNHLYHHRGELVAFLRASGNKVPGLYGPTADDR